MKTAAWILALGLVAGCASRGERDTRVLPPDRSEAAAPGRLGANPSVAEAGAGGVPTVAPCRFSLADVRRRVLTHANPRLAAEVHRVAEARGRTEEAGLWPNPLLRMRKRRIDDFNAIETGFLEVELAQPFELGGKRGARTEHARAEAEAVQATFDALTLAKLREAEMQYFRVLRLEQDLEQAREEAKAAAALEQLSAARFASGKASRIAVLRFEAASEEAALTVEDLARKHAEACRELDDLLGVDAGITLGVSGDWGPTQITASVLDAARVSLEDHPRLDAARKSSVAAEKAVDAVTAGAWPDITLGVEYAHDYDEHEDFTGFMIELPLPFWNRSQGSRAAAKAAVRRARRTVDAESLRLRVEFDAAVIAYRKAARNATGYERDILPRLEESLALTRQAYAVGKSSYMDVLDVMLTLIRARRTRLDHQEAQARAAVEIRYLLGAS